MLYFIYEVTNLINNKKYRGYHKAKTTTDNYMGSGPAIKNAIKKYGKENFKREILEFCTSFEQLLEREEFYVDETWVKRKDTYNMRVGGRCSIGRITGLTDESKKKISETLKKKYASGELVASKPNLGKESINKGKTLIEIVGEEKAKIAKEKMSLIHSNKIPWNKGKKGVQEAWNKGMGKPKKEKTKQIAWNKGVPMPKEKCPHCDVWTNLVNLKRWHGANCKKIS